MSYSLDNLQRPSGIRKKSKRVGRGNSSGKGTYSSRGLKGQMSRSGGNRGNSRRNAFEQIFIRTPKLRGFKRISRSYQVVSLGDLQKNFEDNSAVDVKSLIKKGLISDKGGSVKVLKNGTINKKLKVKANAFSKSAQEAIEKAGGTCETV